MKNPNKVSTFDEYLEQAQDQLKESSKDVGDVSILLQAAGVDPNQVAVITSNPSLVDQLKRRPELAQTYAQRFPSGVSNTYEQFASQLGFTGETEATFGYSGGADAALMAELKNSPS